MDTARSDFVFEGKDGEQIAPEINSIANSGTKFTNAFSAAPWTLPSHGSLFTGEYPSKHGAHAGSKHLPETNSTIAEVFSSEGYDTVAASNNAWISEPFGFGRGFDEFFKGWQYVQSDTDLGKAGLMNEGTDMWKAVAKEIFKGNVGKNLLNALYAKIRFGHSDDDGAKRTNKWVKDWVSSHNPSQPFFMFINYLEPHLEYSPPKEIAERFLPNNVSYKEAMSVPQNAWEYVTDQISLAEDDFEILRCLYAAEIAYTDAMIGDLVDHLKKEGEWDDTIMVILGDHGENIGDHGLMDHQYCLYDSLLHVPLVVHGGQFSDQGVNDSLVQLTDIAPTLLDGLNIKNEEFSNQVQGKSILTTDRDYVVSEYISPQPSRESIEKRVGDPHNLMDKFDRSLRAIRTNEYKYIQGSDGSQELYRVSKDPQERRDIASNDDEVVTELKNKLESWKDSFESIQTVEMNDVDDATQKRLEDLGYI
ncbi:sulfatase [Haloferax sp. ATCC BAA-646]|nr:sulfatase [Haloferax sp. ATCC BAA-646]